MPPEIHTPSAAPTGNMPCQLKPLETPGWECGSPTAQPMTSDSQSPLEEETTEVLPPSTT